MAQKYPDLKTNKRFSIALPLVCAAILFLSMGCSAETADQATNNPASDKTIPAIDTEKLEKDLDRMTKELEQAANDAEKSVTQLSSEFEKTMAIFQEKYKVLAPKIQHIIETFQEQADKMSGGSTIKKDTDSK